MVLVLLAAVAWPRFSPGFAPPPLSQLACAGNTQFRLFVSVLTLVSAPPTSSPPLLTLVFPAAVSSVPGRAARRYSPTKTHMHFQTDEEEEEKEEAVKKRVCEPGRTV